MIIDGHIHCSYTQSTIRSPQEQRRTSQLVLTRKLDYYVLIQQATSVQYYSTLLSALDLVLDQRKIDRFR